MKQLFAGIVLLTLVGIAGFLYRNALEQPFSKERACTMEARICPDGTAVGRTGPSCSFAPCAFPNVEREDVGISFVAPSGFTEGLSYTLPYLVVGYERDGMDSIADAIIVRQIPIPAGKGGEEVMMAETIFSPIGEAATSLDAFTTETLGAHVFYKTTIERFEAQVHVVYYLIRENDVLSFEAIDRSIGEDWMNPALSIDELPTQKVLREMLSVLQTAP